ncbi:uncharacterized protein G2W53_042389 [Senna tora]|uniref:Uncharacterized protein n=1 Tax=Senna tora TaxID=362788 RepID=A0A834SJ09_9FABA|nr:uncharacterized protein G2W53_042389 [Senna tora]
MEAEEVMELYDSCWFELKILKENPNPSKKSSSLSNPDHQIEKESSKPNLSRVPTITRSMSDQLNSMKTSFEHESVSPLKLQTIHSGKEVKDPEAETEVPSQQHHRPNKNISSASSRRRKMRGSKSLSELEFEELKGFMDLGFVFSEEDKDSSLASIIPGLQRLGKKDEEEEEEGDSDSEQDLEIPRPYLSEAWEVLDMEKKQNPLMNWRIPTLSNEIDMKDSLRWWAHTVASTVR